MTGNSAKRAVSSIEHQPLKRQKRYSTRQPPWKEQRELGDLFREAGEGSWPVVRILQEKITKTKKQYLVEWYRHPTTGEEFRPEWLDANDVASDLEQEWEKIKEQSSRNRSRGHTQNRPTVSRNIRQRRAAPLSFASELFDEEDRGSPPALISGRESSVDSGVEISETQESVLRSPVSEGASSLLKESGSHEYLRPSKAANNSPIYSLLPTKDTDAESSQVETTVSDQVKSLTAYKFRDRTASSQLQTTASTPSVIPDSTLRCTSRLRSTLGNLARGLQPNIQSPTKREQPGRALKIVTELSSVQNGSKNDTVPHSVIEESPVSTIALRRLASPFQSARSAKSFHNDFTSPYSTQSLSSRVKMETNGVRQSPRLASATPETGKSSPKVSTRSSSRHRTAEDKEVEPTPLRVANSAADIEPSGDEDTAMLDNTAEEHNMSRTDFAEPSDSTAAEGDYPDTSNSVDEPSVFDSAMASNMIHESIEEEPLSSAATTLSMDSKANSSQESLNNERTIPSVDGTMIPTLPFLGHNEYAVALPAEGKIKSVYDELIKEKRKALLRFISRRGSPGTAEISNKKTSERLAMQDLIQRLNNTCTHVDLGLPPLTQYSLSSPDNAPNAEYAGSKFAMLGYIIEQLKDNDCCFVVMAQPGPLQDLIENFCKMKHAEVRRYDRQETPKPVESSSLKIDLLATQTERVIDLPQKPIFIIAFDISFATSDAQVQRIRHSFDDALPIIHLLVANSSEHVERCVPESLTSNLRLRVVIRTTFLASSYLGGSVTYVPDPSDGHSDGRPMDMGNLQRAVRKSPNRRMALVSDIIAAAALSDNFAENWSLGRMPELQLDDFVESPTKVSRAASVTPQPGIIDQKPISRANTPMAKKRHLDAEPENFTKRQRLTPVPDLAQNPSVSAELTDLRQQLVDLRSELVAEEAARRAADQARIEAETKATEWRDAHSELQRRYEKRRTKTKDLEKSVKTMTSTIETSKTRQEKAENERATLRHQVTQLRSDLAAARSDLKAAGGDTALLEEAREEARNATSKTATLEKSLDNTKKDFEFTRQQYQDASNKAAEMASQISDLELQIKKLEVAASDSKRSLKAMNYDHSIRRHIEAAERVKLEVRNRDAVIKKLQDENSNIKNKRGVQTRGSSVQPGGSPGPRSRQASPAPGFLAPPSHTRASILRNER